MIASEKIINHSVWLLIYGILLCMVLSAGTRLFYRAQRFNLYSHCLLKWESVLTQLSAQNKPLPLFSGNNHREYMETLTRMVQNIPMEIPASNTGRPYVYQLSEKNPSWSGDVFILCLEKKIILYGLSKAAFNMLDKTIDGRVEMTTGKFKGVFQRKNEHYTGIWEL
jgi:hypothetical protein